MSTLYLDGKSLTLQDVVNVARKGWKVEISPEAKEQIKECAKAVLAWADEGRVVYGVTTGFGDLASVVIPRDKCRQLQENLLLSHSCGFGEPYPEDVVRAIMLLRINTLSRGYSGISLETLQQMVDYLNLGIHPVVPTQGSVGASGDLCPGNEQTFEFLENVLTEVMELFPSEYIHVGGDEAGKSAWRTCPKCQARMQAEGLQDVDELQSYLIHRIERFLNAHGRKLLGWDEILDGGLAPNATVMSWRGVEGGMQALRAGHRAIFTPGEFCYLDYTQDAPFTQPASIGGYTPLRKVYSFEPVSEEMTPEQERLLLGVQANLWAEWIPTDAHYEYMMWPRLMALSEVGWSLPERKSYDAFHARALEASELLRARGYEPFDLRTEYGERPESLAPKHHLAEGCPVHYATPWSEKYAASGASTLTDGVLGGWTYGDRRWQGFLDSDVDVTVDLGRVQEVHYIGATFMQSAGPYVWVPRQVEIYGSQDGETYERLATVHNDISPKCPDLLFKTFAYDGAAEVRYIRYVARSGGIPGGWIFVDEIVVQ